MLKQILLELKARLEIGFIAGSNNILSDEHLLLILQKVDMLATKSPVFQKLSALCNAALEDQEHLELHMMEAFAFLNAVLITQADWTYEKETKHITILTEKPYSSIRYSQLKPLIQALSSTGSGRYEIVQTAWIRHPELFHDYRVLPHVIHDLGDSYGELANLNEEILMSCGKKIVPLLKEGFDPAGKKDMLRRIKLIVQLGGKDENEFYLAAYPLAQSAIQKELILGLSCDRENRDYLMQLADTEKGKLKEYAYHVLSLIHDDVVDEYLWQKTKKSKKVLNYALYSNHQEVKELLCANVKEKLTYLMNYPELSTAQKEHDLIELLSSLAYKTGGQIMNITTWIFDHDQALCKIRNSHKHHFQINRNFEAVQPVKFMVPHDGSYTISEYVMETVFHTYLKYRSGEIITMIETLYRQYSSIAGKVYARMLFLQDYAHAYERITHGIHWKNPRELYADIWRYVEYDQDMKQYVFRSILLSDALKQDAFAVPLGDTMDLRWLDELLDKRIIMKGIFKKKEELQYGRELPICSRIMVQLAHSECCALQKVLIPYFEQNKRTVCHLYIKKLYGLCVAADVTAYIKSNKFNQYQIVSIVEHFCSKEEALEILRDTLSQSKNKSEENWNYHHIESTIHRIEESEVY